jgi:hypothetical protein
LNKKNTGPQSLVSIFYLFSPWGKSSHTPANVFKPSVTYFRLQMFEKKKDPQAPSTKLNEKSLLPQVYKYETDC